VARPRRCYLLDASALVAFLLNNPSGDLAGAKRRLLKLFASRRSNTDADYFVPNFCMAECSKAFAKIFLRDDPTETQIMAYRQHVETLLDWVSSKKKYVIKTYKLKREHLVDIESVFIADSQLSSRDGGALSGLDGIIISMGRTLAKKRGRENVFILTTDTRIARLCRANGDPFPAAVDLKNQEIPGT